MNRHIIFALLATATLMGGGAAEAASVTPPSITVTYGEGQTRTITYQEVSQDPETGETIYNWEGPVTLEVPGGTIVLQSFEQILDPTGAFAVAFSSNDAGFIPGPFAIDFPSFPALANNIIFSGSLSGSLTDGTSTPNGVNINPVGDGVVKYVLKRAGVEVTSFFLGDPATFPAQIPPDNSFTYGPFTQSPFIVDCGPLGCDDVDVIIDFTATRAVNDQYSFTGRWDVVEGPPNVVIPEPSATASLIGLGLFGLTLMRRRQHS